MTAIPPTTPPTIAPMGAFFFLLWEPIVGVGLLDCVGAVPCPKPLGMTTGFEADVSVPPTVTVSVTGAVAVMEVVPPPARTRVRDAPASVVDMRSTYKLYETVEHPKL